MTLLETDNSNCSRNMCPNLAAGGPALSRDSPECHPPGQANPEKNGVKRWVLAPQMLFMIGMDHDIFQKGLIPEHKDRREH